MDFRAVMEGRQVVADADPSKVILLLRARTTRLVLAPEFMMLALIHYLQGNISADLFARAYSENMTGFAQRIAYGIDKAVYEKAHAPEISLMQQLGPLCCDYRSGEAKDEPAFREAVFRHACDYAAIPFDCLQSYD